MRLSGTWQMLLLQWVFALDEQYCEVLSGMLWRVWHRGLRRLGLQRGQILWRSKLLGCLRAGLRTQILDLGLAENDVGV